MAQAAERRLSYDKNLLREAEAMQEQFQLRPNRSGFASSSQARLAHSPQPPTSIQFSEKATPSGNELPFWRTTKGKVLVAVVVLVIIGAVVGAAVGTTVHKSQPVTNNTISLAPPVPPLLLPEMAWALALFPPRSPYCRTQQQLLEISHLPVAANTRQGATRRRV